MGFQRSLLRKCIVMAIFQHGRAMMDRAEMHARYFASGMQKGISTAKGQWGEINDIKEEVFSVLLQAASMVLIDHCEC